MIYTYCHKKCNVVSSVTEKFEQNMCDEMSRWRAEIHDIFEKSIYTWFVVKFYILHMSLDSSIPSSQSCLKSQVIVASIHWPLVHRNWPGRHISITTTEIWVLYNNKRILCFKKHWDSAELGSCWKLSSRYWSYDHHVLGIPSWDK